MELNPLFKLRNKNEYTDLFSKYNIFNDRGNWSRKSYENSSNEFSVCINSNLIHSIIAFQWGNAETISLETGLINAKNSLCLWNIKFCFSYIKILATSCLQLFGMTVDRT